MKKTVQINEMATIRPGVTRCFVNGVGYADFASGYNETSPCGWEVTLEDTTIEDKDTLRAVVDAFRKSEGLWDFLDHDVEDVDDDEGTESQPLTEKQAKRLAYLLAYGPQDRKAVDTELDAMGWTQLYDDSDAVECVDGAERRLYDANGCIRAELLPVEWRRS